MQRGLLGESFGVFRTEPENYTPVDPLKTSGYFRYYQFHI